MEPAEQLCVEIHLSAVNNASIGRIRTNARDFHDTEALITMIS